jgi:protein-S-isoprenylcysteine O-methyltransferase Ste14
MPELKFRDLLYRWRVRSALVFLAAVLALARPTPAWMAAGGAFALLGLGVRAWASGHIRKEKTLAVTGPYRYSRNPLYLGNFILGLGIALATNSLWAGGIFLAYFALFYPSIILEERERMGRLFPSEYETYRRHVPLFFPTLSPARPKGQGRWSFALYRKNGEYRALIGAGVVWALFLARWMLG